MILKGKLPQDSAASKWAIVVNAYFRKADQDCHADNAKA